jgi:hypothetical protein
MMGVRKKCPIAATSGAIDLVEKKGPARGSVAPLE